MSKSRSLQSKRSQPKRPRKPQPHYRSGPRGTVVKTTPGKSQYRKHPAHKSSPLTKIGKAIGRPSTQVRTLVKAPTKKPARSFPTKTGRVIGGHLPAKKSVAHAFSRHKGRSKWRSSA